MDGLLLAAALSSALLHAAWNAAVKAQPAPRPAMAAQMIAAALLSGLGLAVTGLPPASAWAWVGASVVLNMVAVTALLRAYEHGGFGTVYPVVRATAVLGVAAVARLLLGESLSPHGLAGVAMIVAALGALALDARRGDAHRFAPRALAWTLLAGAFTSAYVLADAQGARASGSPMAYGFAVSVGNALAMAGLTRDAGAPWTLLRRHWRLALPASLASMASYLLILWVFTRAPVAPAAAVRDTSAVFAMLIAALWLKEPMRPARWAVLGLAVAGAVLLRMA